MLPASFTRRRVLQSQPCCVSLGCIHLRCSLPPGLLRSPDPLSQPGAPGLPQALGPCPDSVVSRWHCPWGQAKTKSSMLLTASAELRVGLTGGWEDAQQRLSPASARTPGTGGDLWLPCHLRKPGGHWKQTVNPGTSQMRSRWLPGTRFLNIPPLGLPFSNVVPI